MARTRCLHTTQQPPDIRLGAASPPAAAPLVGRDPWSGGDHGGCGVLVGEATPGKRVTPPKQKTSKPACVSASNWRPRNGWDRATLKSRLCAASDGATALGRGDTAAALKLQRQLVQSDRGTARQRQTDRDTLAIWQQRLRDQALALFRDGELDAAVALLSPLEGKPRPRGRAERHPPGNLEPQPRGLCAGAGLIQAERWWEALDNLNRLDHPWWQAHAAPAQEKVLAAIERLRETQEHHQHGESSPDVIGGALLDGEVQRHLQDGLEPWDAFERACASLGGAVAEDGPESFCQRQQPGGS